MDLEERVEGHSAAEQKNDVEAQKASDVAQDDVLEHDGENVQAFDGLGEVDEVRPARQEDEGHDDEIVVEVNVAVEHDVPRYGDDAEAESENVAQVGDQQVEGCGDAVEKNVGRVRVFFAVVLHVAIDDVVETGCQVVELEEEDENWPQEEPAKTAGVVVAVLEGESSGVKRG